MPTTRRSLISLLLAGGVAALAAPAATLGAERHEPEVRASEQQEAQGCDEYLTPAEVAATCRLAPVSVNPEDKYPGDRRSFQARVDALGGMRLDLTKCAKKFEAEGNRALMLTIGKTGSGSDNRAIYESTESIVAQDPDYAGIAGLGDAARRYSTGETGATKTHTVEFVARRWIVSIRTTDGEFEGERFARMCDYAQLERLARIVEARLP